MQKTRARLLHHAQENNYTASPLRAFENELGDRPPSLDGESLRLCGARGLSAGDSGLLPQLSNETSWACEHITTLMLILAFVTHVFLTSSQLVIFATRPSYMFQLMLQVALCTWHSLHSMLGLFLAMPTILLCAPARCRRCAVPCRRIGRRRFSLPRSSRGRSSHSLGTSRMLCFCTLLLLHSTPLLACCGQFCFMLPFSPFDVALITRVMLGNPLPLAFVSAACARLLIYIVLLGRSIAHRVGLLCQRVGEASHPGPSGDIDPWASYLEKKRHDPTRLQTAPKQSKALRDPCGSIVKST